MTEKKYQVNHVPKLINYLLLICLLILTGLFFFPLTPGIPFGVFLFKRLSGWVRYFWFSMLVLLSIFLGYYYYVSLNILNDQLLGSSVSTYNILFWISEIFHFTLMILAFYCIYRTFRYKYAPYSGLYIVGYFGTHVIYNGCPITETQNYLALQGTIEPVANTFLQIELGLWETPLRILVGSFLLILTWSIYKQFSELDIKPRHYLDWWNEPKLSKANNS